ncbi:acyltransferase family protein [Runella slithyformis]|uniref:Acyltransferase 3 n=1 Tax=Runella slithyformis (strain ATCC 29530 / DSM 19594 / LMG 11500 / NCIMB 11436 / LSU 4) TaxID=761193 RepID=A0A7U3ZM74_RUNSL|nr:acyltransferase [Runella slithyformis]AEI49774.1 acyltransferase 3 [Runella slithyformis DSM 19594]
MKHRFRILDTFRGIFASMVVFFHLADFADTPLLNNDFVRNSDMFVDFFFVLSGFVIAYNYQSFSKTEDIGMFLQKRLYRIYPLHVLMLFAFLFIELVKGSLSAYVQVNQPVGQNNNLYSFLTSLFLINSVRMPGINDVSWNIPSWSISAEMISYVVYGLCLWLMYKWKMLRQKFTFFLLITLLAFTAMVWTNNSFRLNYSFDYGFLRGIIGFFIGAFCYGIFDRSFAYFKNLPKLFFDCAEVLVMGAIISMIYFGAYLKEVGGVYEVLFFVSILIFSFERGVVSDVLKKSVFLDKVGLYSYSIYMTHALLISLFNVLFVRILKFPPSAYVYLVFANYYLIYKVSEWTYKHIEMRFKVRKKTAVSTV